MFNNLRSFTHVPFFSVAISTKAVPLLPLLISVHKHAFISFTVACTSIVYVSSETQSILRERSISAEFQSFQCLCAKIHNMCLLLLLLYSISTKADCISHFVHASANLFFSRSRSLRVCLCLCVYVCRM